jgi:hypothetical protein
MITITLAAKHIPEHTRVRKPTGSTYYTLRREIQIYGEGGRIIYRPPEVVFLRGENSDSGFLEDRKLSIDFDSPGEASEWLFEHFPMGDYE